MVGRLLNCKSCFLCSLFGVDSIYSGPKMVPTFLWVIYRFISQSTTSVMRMTEWLYKWNMWFFPPGTSDKIDHIMWFQKIKYEKPKKGKQTDFLLKLYDKSQVSKNHKRGYLKTVFSFFLFPFNNWEIWKRKLTRHTKKKSPSKESNTLITRKDTSLKEWELARIYKKKKTQ